MDYAADAYKFGALLIGLHGVGRLAGFDDLAAHVVPQAVAFLVLAVLGVDAWRSMYLRRRHDAGRLRGSPRERHKVLYCRSPSSCMSSRVRLASNG